MDAFHSHSTHDAGATSFLTPSRVLVGLAIGGAAAVILAPHVLPALGIGSGDMAAELMWTLHTHEAGSGIAGGINQLLASVPLVGKGLAAGGVFNAAATGVVGIGGVLLGNFIARREDGSHGIKWGNVIKYGALLTSALIALPTVLTALGAGIIYLANLLEPVGSVSLTNSVIGWVDKTIGTMGPMGGAVSGLSGAAAALPHFLTCGVSLLPAALSFSLLEKNPKTEMPAAPDPMASHITQAHCVSICR